MPVIILCMFQFVRLLSSGHQAIAVENLALRRQLAAFKRKRKKPLLTQWDRLFWVGLSRLWSGSGIEEPFEVEDVVDDR
jgi:putative transposase